jgi:1,4-dihydroxy-2-naphthoate octaprenyltransferase
MNRQAAGGPSLARRWWVAVRPHSLGTAVAPVLVAGGVAARDGGARPWAFVLAVLGVVFLLVGVNLANDYFDFRSGADPPLGVGNRPLQRGLLAPRAFLAGAIVAFVVGGLAGVLLALASPPAVLLVGLAGALLGFFYTAPPLRLGYHGLGEIVVFLCLGPGAAFGAYAAIVGRFAASPIGAAIPIGLTVTAILQANNLRDLDDDARSGKRTLAVRLGPAGARAEYVVLVAGSLAAVVILAVLATPFAALGLLTFPWAVRALRTLRANPFDGRALMRDTAAVHVRLAALLALGFAVSRLV